MNAIIFGINGQDGHYLTRILQSEGIQVVGVSRSNNNWRIGDVGDFSFVLNLIKELQPDYVFHLAANSTTKHEFLFEHNETIGNGSLNILEAVFKHSPHSKVFISGSALQFENKGLPILETDDFCANDTYSIARIHSVFAARYFRTLGIKVYVGYFFNHDSPLRSERHVNQKIVNAAKRISLGLQQELELGNIEVKKEFTFAGDTAEAIWLLIKNNECFEAVIGSGKAYSIIDWLNIVFENFNLDWKKHVIVNHNFKSDYDILVSNPKTILKLGWQPKISIIDLAKLMLNESEKI